MGRYIIRRLLASVPSVIGLTMVLFLLVRLMPGDAALLKAFASEDVLQNVNDPQVVEDLRKELGIDKPIPIQYVQWVGDMARGKFGTSYWSRNTVKSEIIRRLPVTLELLVLSMMVSVGTGVFIGVVSAVYQDGPIDYLARLAGILGLSVPSFWIALLVILLPALWWNYLPPLGYVPFFDNPIQNLKQFGPAALTLGWALSAGLMRLTRSEVLEVMRQDYVRTARAKGLSELTTIRKHVLRNSLIPVVTVVGLEIGSLIGGSVVIETVWGLPGIGRLVLTAINQRDYPVVQATVLFASLAFLLSNLVVDLSYGLLDPRIRYR
ncbi:MAG: ABC transporter permease [Dehalococcoidia bacterium]|nr:ABC transporter permease [Dehalococcoidia bacterium]